jgi:hypothetical protein
MTRALCLALALLHLIGCATLPDGRRWGEDATIAPGWERVRSSATHAARSPWVWAPLVGAGVMQFNNWDRKVSNWARRETPLFGSQRNADRLSDHLELSSRVAQTATALLTPGGEFGTEWWVAKAKGYAVDLAAMGSTAAVTGILKRTTKRERPNGQDDMSFPSGHASSAAVNVRLAERHLELIAMNRPTRLALDGGLYAIGFGTAWARIEAGKHFPADTLFSIGLGNFFGAFFTDAFLGLAGNPAYSVAFTPVDGHGYMLSWQASF